MGVNQKKVDGESRFAARTRSTRSRKKTGEDEQEAGKGSGRSMLFFRPSHAV